MGLIGPVSSVVEISGSVDTETSIPNVPTGGTQIVRSASGVGIGSTDIYTVTAGKTLYITSAWVSDNIYAAGVGLTTVEADNEGTGTYYPIVGVSPAGLAGSATSPASAISLSPPIVVPATKKVRVTRTGNSLGAGGFSGYEL